MTQRVPFETIYDQIDRVQMQLLKEADELIGIREVGLALVVIAFEFGKINQQLRGGGFAGEWMCGHRVAAIERTEWL